MRLRTGLLAASLVVLTGSLAWGHPQHLHAPGPSGLAAGFLHPLLGLDHLLAMFAVGLLAAQLGGRALWILPAAFLGTMGLGGALGMAGYGFPLNELAIAISVVALGIAIAVGRKYPLVAAAVVVGLFGMIHGHAHGTEMPALAAGALYGTGFFVSTAALHLAGIGAGLFIVRQPRYGMALQLAGAAISLAGLVILTQAQ